MLETEISFQRLAEQLRGQERGAVAMSGRRFAGFESEPTLQGVWCEEWTQKIHMSCGRKLPKVTGVTPMQPGQ